MFESLSERLSHAFKSLTGRGQLTEENIQSGLREVRLALLEADVNFAVVKSFVENIRSKCVGQDLIKGVNPGQQVAKIVYDELTSILGGETGQLKLQGEQPAGIMLVGLQGSGKTTSAGKLANLLRKQKMRPYLVPLDVYRPAAIDQLMSLGRQLNIPCFPSTTEMKPQEIAVLARERAREEQATVMLLDTAGRLQVDEALMNELADLRDILHPQEILFVADAMTGQEAVNVAQSFHEKIPLTGVVLTKMDGDARGGAALSIRSVIGAPVKFVGVGEKLSDLETFHPDRIAGRILGMGDILTLVEKAQENFDAEQSAALAKKMQRASFDLEDFRNQMRQIKKLGPLESVLKLIPGLSGLKEQLEAVRGESTEKELAKIEAIINSMTPAERHDPDILNGSRRRRIAKGSGTTVQDVNQLVKQFDQMRKMIKNALQGKALGREAQSRLNALGGNPLQGLNLPGMQQGPLGGSGLPPLPSGFGSGPRAGSSAARKKKRKEKRRHGKK